MGLSKEIKQWWGICPPMAGLGVIPGILYVPLSLQGVIPNTDPEIICKHHLEMGYVFPKLI